MCGIASFIGESKNYPLSCELFKHLFVLLEERGIDAAGFYGSKINSDIFLYHKQQGKASQLTNTTYWKEVEDNNLDLLMVHTRKSSSISASSLDNNNNHPFIGIKNKTALVHNGVIHEYQKLIKNYEVFSKCDSEILLKILDLNFDYLDYTGNRFKQIKGLLGLIKNSEFTFLLSDIFDEKKSLWAVKNEFRPLVLIDAREYLNQFIFVSTIDIWQNAVDKLKDCNLKKCKVYFLEKNFIINILYHNKKFETKFFVYNWEKYDEFNLIN